jgi:uncharacterized protein (DUF58 family)
MKMHPWFLKQFKKRARIYIMPTRMGGYLNGLIFLMLLLSVGYGNNLLLIFTLFLFGLNLIWVIQTHFHLHALRVDSVTVNDGFALENSIVEIFWRKTPDVPHKWNFKLFAENVDLKLDVLENSHTKSISQIIFPKRGVWCFQHLMISSEMPFGLYKAWIYLPINAKAHAYPAKLKDPPIINIDSTFNDGDIATSRPGPHDVWNLGPYQGESSRRISWKHYARTGELVVKEGEEFSKAVVHFRLPLLKDNKEFILSKIATQMIQCSMSDIPFSFEKKSASLTSQHLTDCLRELSLC